MSRATWRKYKNSERKVVTEATFALKAVLILADFVFALRTLQAEKHRNQPGEESKGSHP